MKYIEHAMTPATGLLNRDMKSLADDLEREATVNLLKGIFSAFVLLAALALVGHIQLS